MKKLYVGNLPFSYRNEELEALFSPYGPLTSFFIIFDKNTRRSRGYGFVELEDDMAMKAVAELNGKEIEGRAIVVNEARPKEE